MALDRAIRNQGVGGSVYDDRGILILLMMLMQRILADFMEVIDMVRLKLYQVNFQVQVLPLW